MTAYFQPQQSSLNKDASQQYHRDSRALTPAWRNYPANERELLAVVEVLQVWCHLLEVAPRILEATDSMINATKIQPK
jgi:RNase H-like domain found in reverse transcriptase